MKPPAFQCYADDLLAGTIEMTNEEFGCYWRLCLLQWNKGFVTGENFERIGKGMAVPSLNHVKAKFKKFSDGTFKNKRMESEREKQQKFRENRSKSGKSGAESRWHSHSTAITQLMAKHSSPSPSPSPFIPSMADAEKWLADWKNNGADYKSDEMKSAFLALSANGWMWGKNPIVDFRAALERQIQTDRTKKPYEKNIKPNPRNVGVVGDLAENARKTDEFVKRQQAERDAEHEAV